MYCCSCGGPGRFVLGGRRPHQVGLSVAAHSKHSASTDVPLSIVSDDTATGEEEHLLGRRGDHLQQPGDAGTRTLFQRLAETPERDGSFGPALRFHRCRQSAVDKQHACRRVQGVRKRYDHARPSTEGRRSERNSDRARGHGRFAGRNKELLRTSCVQYL